MNIEPLEARIAPAGSGLGSVTATLPLTETTDSPTAIVDSTFQSASSLGNIIGTVNGVRTSSGNGQLFGGIGNGAKMFAGTTIGDIMGLCNAGGGAVTGGIAYGLGEQTVKAGLAGTGLGGIGHIAGIVSSGDAGAGFGITGNGASFDAAAGTAHGSDSAVGGIASITGRSSTTSLSSFGIAGGTFRAIGDIGAITGSSAVSGGIALTGVTVSTGGNLASVTATGNVKVSKFLPI